MNCLPLPAIKKQNLHSHCGRSQNSLYLRLWAVVWIRTQEAIQQVVDQASKAKWYYSDGFDAYQWLWYHLGRYEVYKGKADTYSVEADNAELRHYLARLARKSRCFYRCPRALECALRLFVHCFNSR
ncbi:MAG: IS1 family transposase [Deltaproteobacteria bacterium]|nr:IS1 family transposase [Deltaproteobacteria bacterium]